MNIKLILVGCIIASVAVAQIAAQCACGAEGEDVCSCSLTRVPRPQQLPRFQPRQIVSGVRKTCTCASSSPPSRQQFSPIGDRCSCGNSAVVPAIRPPSSCQVGVNTGRGRRGMLGLFGLRGALAQLAPGIGGISFNSRVLPRLPINQNTIVKEVYVEADDNSIVT